MIKLHQLILLICLGLPTSLLADSLKPYAYLDTFLLSEPITLGAVDNQWQGTYHPNGEKQLGSLWFESGFKKGTWSFGILYREELQLNFHTDTADLYYTVENSGDLTIGRTYQIDLDAYRFRGIGARASKRFSINDTLSLSVGTSLFAASKLLDGGLNGSALANADDEYEYFISGNYQYSEDVLFERKRIDEPTGIGLALDLSASWKPNPQWHVSANIRDLTGAIFWKDVPYTEATANSDTTSVGNNGFAQVNPILSGFEGYHSNHTQRLKPSATFNIDYLFKETAYSASLKFKHKENLNLFALGGRRNMSCRELALHYWPEIQTLEAAYKGEKFGIKLGLDNIDISESRVFWLSLVTN